MATIRNGNGILSPQDSDAFVRLWSCIDAYVNTRTKVLPGFLTPEQLRGTKPDQLQQVRKNVWEQRTLLDEFVSENPFSLSSAELIEVQLFRHAVRGRFFVERCLKDYAVFVSAGQGAPSVYAVGGLTERIDDVLYRGSGLGYATLVETTLVPFRGRIVWDGIVSLYNITFGPGARRGFKDAYIRAKDRGAVVLSLDPEAVKPKARVVGPDWRPVVDSIVAASSKLGRANTSLQAASFRLLEVSALMAQAAVHEPFAGEELSGLLRKAERSLKQIWEALERESSC
jgi:hypothetical protein